MERMQQKKVISLEKIPKEEGWEVAGQVQAL